MASSRARASVSGRRRAEVPPAAARVGACGRRRRGSLDTRGLRSGWRTSRPRAWPRRALRRRATTCSWAAGRRDGGGAGAQPPGDDPVVAVDEEAEHEQRDRDRHHPGALGELRLDHEPATTPVATAPSPLTSARRRHPGPRRRCQYRTIPACESVKAVKTPITYRWSSESDVRAEHPDQQRRGAREHDDPVRVDEPVAEVDELAREEAVAREHGAEPGEALVRRVRREHEDRERQALDRVEHERAARPAREDARARSRRSRETLSSAGRASATASYETPMKREIAIPAIDDNVRAAFLPWAAGMRRRRSRSPRRRSAPRSRMRTRAGGRRARPPHAGR